MRRRPAFFFIPAPYDFHKILFYEFSTQSKIVVLTSLFIFIKRDSLSVHSKAQLQKDAFRWLCCLSFYREELEFKSGNLNVELKDSSIEVQVECDFYDTIYGWSFLQIESVGARWIGEIIKFWCDFFSAIMNKIWLVGAINCLTLISPSWSWAAHRLMNFNLSYAITRSANFKFKCDWNAKNVSNSTARFSKHFRPEIATQNFRLC